MNKRILTATLLTLWLAAVGAPAALAAPVVHRPAATAAAPAETNAQGTVQDQKDRARDAARYAAAEKKQPRAAEFEGGAQIVIVGSTLAIVLGVVLVAIII